MFFRRFLLVLGTLALLAGVALTAIWLAYAPPQRVEAPKAPPQTTVLAAARPIAAGSLLRAEDMRWKQVPADTVIEDHIRQGEVPETELFGAVVRREFATGEPLLASQVIKPTESGFLAAVLAPGTRAVSINVGAAEGNAGLIAPGDRVDVILTQSFSEEEAAPPSRLVGETVLRDLRVVAVGQEISAAAQPTPGEKRLAGPEPRLPKTITLEVADSQAEALLVANQLGKVQLALLSLEKPARPEAAAPPVSPVWAGDVSAALRVVVRQPAKPGETKAPAKAAPRAVIEIEIMRGMKTERRCFGEGVPVGECGGAPDSGS